MSDQPPKPQSLSEIGHLFLSGIRDKHTNGGARPVRVPPGARGQMNLPSESALHDTTFHELTPEESALMSGSAHSADVEIEADSGHVPAITAVISQHLNGRATERVAHYARHLAANGERIGLIELDSSEFRLMCFERSTEPNAGDPDPAEAVEHFDARQIAESMEELNCDIDRWLIVLPNLRTLEARALLKDVDHWALLSTTDHDGVVSCYRTLKGLANLGSPRMTLALMETTGEVQATKVFRKLSSVCVQFLGIELKSEPAVRPTQAVAEHVVAHVRPRHDKAQIASSAQWLVMTEFVSRLKAAAAEAALREEDLSGDESESEVSKESAPLVAANVASSAGATVNRFKSAPPSPQQSAFSIPETDTRAPSFGAAIPSEAPAMTFAPRLTSAHGFSADESAPDPVSEVIDLPGELQDPGSIVSAILTHLGSEMFECPIRPPMCPEARLAISRERGLVLLAAPGKGLRDLKLISQAYRWLNENRTLIGMAMPQMAIDAHRLPRLRLLVEHTDASADTLAPMLESGMVSVQAYRKLRWGARTGLLLEAA